MSAIQPLSSAHQSVLFRHNDESGFHLGHFDRFVDGVGEIICPESGLRYIFGPESIDLGPCCNSCDENWIKILKNEDILVFSQGHTYSCGNKLVKVAKQVIIPETCSNQEIPWCSFT